MNRRSVWDTREPKWLALLTTCVEKHQLGEAVQDDLFELVMTAIAEDAAVHLGSRGGLKGGAARAAKMTPRQRRASAAKAAHARWRKVKGGQR